MNPRGKIIPKILRICCLHLLPAVIFTFFLAKTARAQVNTDSTSVEVPVNIPDSVAVDSNMAADTLAQADSSGDGRSRKQQLEDSLGIKISPDALESVVTSEAKDSAVLDMKNNQFYLYGNAKVNYENLELEAGQIRYSQATNMVTAAPPLDSAMRISTKPTFTQGQEKFTYDSLQYNFKSKKAIVRNARSQYGEGFVFSDQVKRNPDQSIYGLHSIYTTCSLDTPHFGIRARRIKVIPGKVAATGPANIEIEEVPTPIFLPFGLFPISQGQRSGFRLPTYTIEESRGLGLVNGGYYFAINDRVDLLLQANLYSKGSWSTSGVSTYTNRYRYSGGISFSYAYNKTGESYEPSATIQKDFNLQWSHRSDPKSRPGVNFTSNVNFGTSTFNQFNTYNVNQILQNQYTSNITYSKQWANKPYSLSVAARHSQNLTTRAVDVTLPEATFFVSQFNPFQHKGGSSTKWYDKITTQYTVLLKNNIRFYDSAFSPGDLSLNDMQNGIVHTIPITASYNILRFINMNFGTTYHEYWLTQRTYRYWNAAEQREDTNIYRGLNAVRDFNASVGLNTRIYGLKMFKKGKLMGIRHVLTPNVSMTYTPDFAKAPYRYGYRTILNPINQPQYLSAYETSPVGGPTQFGNFSSLLGFGIDNNLQIKVRNENDSTGSRNIRLIDNFRIGTGYDLARDSFNWSPVDMSFATNLFNVLNITANAMYSLYDIDTATGRDVKYTLWDRGKGLARFRTASASVGGSFQSKNRTDDGNTAPQNETVQRMMEYGRYSDYVDFNVPWNFSFTYTLQVANNYDTKNNDDTLAFTHSVMFNGSMNVTPNWKLEVYSGYDFTNKRLNITQINIYRDLHCWEIRLGAVPFGPNKNYNFTLNVKATVLQDLKLMRRRDFRDVAN